MWHQAGHTAVASATSPSCSGGCTASGSRSSAPGGFGHYPGWKASAEGRSIPGVQEMRGGQAPKGGGAARGLLAMYGGMGGTLGLGALSLVLSGRQAAQDGLDALLFGCGLGAAPSRPPLSAEALLTGALCVRTDFGWTDAAAGAQNLCLRSVGCSYSTIDVLAVCAQCGSKAGTCPCVGATCHSRRGLLSGEGGETTWCESHPFASCWRLLRCRGISAYGLRRME